MGSRHSTGFPYASPNAYNAQSSCLKWTDLVLGRIRRSQQYKNLPVVMISTDSTQASVEAAMRLGATDFLAKPFTPTELISRLNLLGLTQETNKKTEEQPKPRPSLSGDPHTKTDLENKSIRLLLVDDSVAIRGILSKTLREMPGIIVTGTAANGEKALNFLEKEQVDIVLLDIEMPVMDGIETLRHIRKKYPRLPVVMFSSLTERGAKATLEALVAGANDYVPKPTATDNDSIVARIESELVPKLRAVYRPPVKSKDWGNETASKKLMPTVPRKTNSQDISVLVIGVSTGGPSGSRRDSSHISVANAPPYCSCTAYAERNCGLLAERLSKMCKHRVSEASWTSPATRTHLPGTWGLTPRNPETSRRGQTCSHDGPLKIRADHQLMYFFVPLPKYFIRAR